MFPVFAVKVDHFWWLSWCFPSLCAYCSETNARRDDTKRGSQYDWLERSKVNKRLQKVCRKVNKPVLQGELRTRKRGKSAQNKRTSGQRRKGNESEVEDEAECQHRDHCPSSFVGDGRSRLSLSIPPPNRAKRT